MLKLYKVPIKLLSPICTPLKGDTLWGHFVWGIANHEGDEAVAKFLEDSKSDEPPLIVSSAFPSGMICKPIPEPHKHESTLSKKQYAEIKKNKKSKYVSASDYLNNTAESQQTNFKFEKTSTMHNTINRYSNSVVEGGLFATEEMWANQLDFDVYLLSFYEISRLKELCTWAFENGYGADSSVGKGNVEVSGEIVEVTSKKNTSKYVALAPFVLEDLLSVNNLRADIFVRNGKIGGSFASGLSPWKKTVILYKEGAVFESNKPITFIGKLITDVHSDSRICQSGFAPVIPIE